eukprot:21778_1
MSDAFIILIVLIIIFVVIRNRNKNKEGQKERKLTIARSPQSYKQIENEEWVTFDSSDKLAQDIYTEQLEGIVEDTEYQRSKLKDIWNSGQWSGRFEHSDGRVIQIPYFTLSFCFDTDTCVGYGQENIGEYLITGYFSPYSNRLAFKQQFMDTPGGDDGIDEPSHPPVDFQLRWNKQDKLFVGNFYVETEDVKSSGVVVIQKDR